MLWSVGNDLKYLAYEIQRHPSVEKSDMLFTNTIRRPDQEYGNRKASGWIVKPNPGPDVRGSPSFWYLAWPIALSRFASASASHPAEIRSQPVVGFQVTSVHSMPVPAAIESLPCHELPPIQQDATTN